MLKTSAISVASLLLLAGAAFGQPAEPTDWALPTAPPPPVETFNSERIMGVIPDYQTVTETPGGRAIPLTGKQKWSLALKETVDPFNLVNAVIGAAFSQKGNQ